MRRLVLLRLSFPLLLPVGLFALRLFVVPVSYCLRPVRRVGLVRIAVAYHEAFAPVGFCLLFYPDLFVGLVFACLAGLSVGLVAYLISADLAFVDLVDFAVVGLCFAVAYLVSVGLYFVAGFAVGSADLVSAADLYFVVGLCFAVGFADYLYFVDYCRRGQVF